LDPFKPFIQELQQEAPVIKMMKEAGPLFARKSQW